MQYDATLARPRGRFMTPYLSLWLVLAGAALLYLGVLAVKPDLVALYIPVEPASADPETNEGQRAMTEAVAEVQTLRDSVGRLQQDIDTIKSDLAARDEREREHDVRLTALEVPAHTVALAAADASSIGAKRAPGKAPAQAQAQAQPQGKAAPAAAAAGKAPPAKVINGADKLETGSVKTAGAALDFTPSVVKAAEPQPAAAGAQRPIGLRVATGPSIDALRLSWSVLTDRHGDTLKSLEPRYVTGIDESGLTYDLVAGPVKTAAEAQRVCAELQGKGIRCTIGEYAGEAL